jgi:hypothetical protein
MRHDTGDFLGREHVPRASVAKTSGRVQPLGHARPRLQKEKPAGTFRIALSATAAWAWHPPTLRGRARGGADSGDALPAGSERAEI